MTDLRSRYLETRQHESELIVTSRKRKLRELYAVADCDGPIPINWGFANSDAPAATSKLPTPSTAELRFLEQNDILQRRFLDEASIPARRPLQSLTANGTFFGRKELESNSPDSTRHSGKGLRDEVRFNRDGTPGKNASSVDRPVDTFTAPADAEIKDDEATHDSGLAPIAGTVRSSHEGRPTATQQTDPAIPTFDLMDTSDARSAGGAKGGARRLDASEQDRIRNTVESRPGSPGVDPRKAIPMSAEDVSQFPGQLVNGSSDENHNAAVAHFPPRDVQEKKFERLRDRATGSGEGVEPHSDGNLTISLPQAHTSRALGEPLSSPASTIDVNSATTPAMHEVSADTSPENEGPRYYAERADGKDAQPQTPPEFRPSKEAIQEKEEHDRLLKAQIDLARAEILGSSPTAADAQLRLEEEQAAAASSSLLDREVPDSDREPESSQETTTKDVDKQVQEQRTLTQSAGEVVQEIVEDEDDEVVGVPTPDEGGQLRSDGPSKRSTTTSRLADERDASTSKQLSRQELEEVDGGTEVASRAANEHVQGSAAPAKDIPTSIADQSTSAVIVAPSAAAPAAPIAITSVSEGSTIRSAPSSITRHQPEHETTVAIPRSEAISVPSESARAKHLIVESNHASGTATPNSSSSRIRSMLEKVKEKERSKLSTVVFAKHLNHKGAVQSMAIASTSKAKEQESAAYFMPLIMHQAYQNTPGIQPLEKLLMTAHKTITTSNAHIPYRDAQTIKIINRIHTLQVNDQWSFRQPKRCPEPNRPASHWDQLLKEAKWMRTDFREERKWKAAVARTLAKACAEWVEADEATRRSMQVNAFIPPAPEPKAFDHAGDDHPTPELVPSAGEDSPGEDFDEEPRASMLDIVAPGVMFTPYFDDLVFPLSRSAATDKLLENLPLWGPDLQVPQSDLPVPEIDPDASWRLPAIPISKYATGQIVLKDDGPPKKKSRYEYELDAEDVDEYFKRGALEPELRDVALFNPENKHIRDRIHSSHQFRPPSEYPMPLQSFFECRMSSQWTWAEDDELKQLVREYSYNWQLISSMLTSRSLFSSSAERRTPWECFERWIHLEGLPADMQKTHYFRAYNNRLEAAQRNVLAQAAAVQPQPTANGAALTPARRRTTTSIRVERRRNQKHLTLVDAMRKLAKKRETSLQKQQHAAGLAAMRKANEGVQQPANQKYTPQEFSKLKHEREMEMIQRIQKAQMLQEAQRRQALPQQGRVGPPQAHQQFPNGIPQQQRLPPNASAIPSVNVPPGANRPNQLGFPVQAHPQLPMQNVPQGMAGQMHLPNGHAPTPQIPLKGIPQAQMRGLPGMPAMQGLPPQHRMAAPNNATDMQVMMQARQISEQQRQAVQLQQQHGQNGPIHSSPPNMRATLNGMTAQSFTQGNQGMMAAFNAGNMNGVSTPPANGLNAPLAASPRMAHPNQTQQANGVSQIQKLENSIRTQHPNATPEQINKLVRDTLMNHNLLQQQQRQSAMHAAAGSGSPLPGIPPGMQNSPQQYAQMLRAHQQQQAATANQQQRNGTATGGSGFAK